MSKDKKQAVEAQGPIKVDKPEVDLENSPGKQLIKAREALGLTQEQVADRLHLRINSVRAVEQDTPEPGVSVTFSKGYVRLYAKLVHLETEPLLAAYDKIHKQAEQPAKLQSFSKRVTREAHDQRWNMVTIVVVLLVIGSVIGWWVQQSDSFKDSQSFVANTFDSLFSESENAQNENDQTQTGQSVDTTSANDDVVAVRLNVGPEISEEAVAELEKKSNTLTQDIGEEEVQDATELMPNMIDDDIETLDDNVNVVAELTSNPSNNMIDEASDLAAEATSSFTADSGTKVNEDATANMVFTFKEDCWVSVKDANDEVIAIGVKTKGRVMEVSGLAPINVILCSPTNVDIVFNGKNVDMSIYPKTRTANFTLQVEND